MTITISEFWCGVLATIGVEIGAFILTLIYYATKNSLKSRRNASNSSRSNKNE